LPERLAQGGNLYLQVVLLHDHAGPDLREQVILRDQLPGTLDEQDQQVESARSQGHRLAVIEQTALGGLQLEATEPTGSLLRRGGGDGTARMPGLGGHGRSLAPVRRPEWQS